MRVKSREFVNLLGNMLSDPIADMLIRLKNGAAAGRGVIEVPLSNLRAEIARVLQEAGYVKSVNKKGKKGRKFLELELTKIGNNFKLRGATRVSKPSRRVYQGFRDLRSVKQGTGYAVLSTPQGVMTGIDARKKGLGGEVLFKIW